MSVVNVVKES